MATTQIILDSNGSREVSFTPEEQVIRDELEKEWADEIPLREMIQIREHRDNLLSGTDHFALADFTLTDDMKTYRQALRDIPASNTVYADVTWPTKPE